MLTRRQEIIKFLEEQPMSINQIANLYKTKTEEILEDIPHIKKTIHPKKLKIIPAVCKKCGFVFKERTKLRAPSKCPRCRSEWISEPLFKIEQNGK